MTRTLAQLVTDTRDRLDEVAATFWTDVQLRKWINDGTREVARRSETLLATKNIAVTAATQSYTGPTDCIRINRAEWIPTGQTTVYPLEYKDYNGMDAVWWTSQKITQGYPQFFTMWGFPPTLTITLYPTPSQNGTLKVYYYRQPADLSTTGSDDGTVVDVPEGWWDLIVHYAEFMALRRDRDPRWQEARGIFEDQLAHMIDITRRWSDQAGSFEQGIAVLPSWLWAGDY